MTRPCRVRPPAFAVAILALFATLLGTMPTLAAVPAPTATTQTQTGGELNASFSGRRLFLPLIVAGVPPTIPPAIVNSELTLRPVPLRQVQRGTALSVEFRYRNTGTATVGAAVFNLFYPERLTSFDWADLGPGDFRASHDSTRVTVQLTNVRVDETRTGRINFLVRRSANVGAQINLFADFECRRGEICRSNTAQVDVVANDDENNHAGGTFAMSVSPDRGRPGTAHTFQGSRFTPREEFRTWLNLPDGGVQALDITGRADNNGNIRFTYGTGTLTEGFYSLVAHGVQSNVQGVGTFIVTGPTISGALNTDAGLSGGAALPIALAPLAPAPAPAQATGDGGVSGRVVNALGQGVAGVPVEVRDANDSMVALALSRADGAYFIATGLATGEYTLRARPALGLDREALQFYADATAGPVQVNAPELTPAVILTLPAAGGVQGSVTGNGAPVPGVLVTVRNAEDVVLGLDITDAAGAYLVANLLPGTYRVEFDQRAAPRGGGFAPGLVENVTVAAGQFTSQPFTLIASSTGGTISGRVTGVGGVGLEDVIVVFTRPDSNDISFANTEADGSYTSDPLVPGSYRLQFLTLFANVLTTTRHLGEYYNDAATREAATLVPVTAGQTVTGIDAALEAGASVSGMVTGDGGAGLASVTVVAYDATLRPRAFAQTDAMGAYTLRGLPAGAYTVQFITSVSADATTRAYQNTFYDDNPAAPPDRTVVEVAAAAEVTGINGTLARGVPIVGTVTGADTGAGLAGVFVVVFDATTRLLVTVALTDANGDYATAGLRRGGYKLLFTTIFSPDATARAYADEYFNNTTTFADGQVVVVADPGPRQVNVELAPGGSISGRVTAEDTGAGLGLVFVVARQGTTSVGGAITADDGTYTLVGLPAGQVTVQFITELAPQAGVRRYVGEYYDDQSTGPGTPVEVPAGGAVTDINATLSVRL